MAKQTQSLADFFKLLMDPNVTDADIEKFVDDIEREEEEAGLPDKEKRPKNEKDVLVYLAKRQANTSLNELKHYLNTYHDSMEVARLVARHPALDIHWLAHFLHLLPEDAKNNPNYDSFSENDKWQETLQRSRPRDAEGSKWILSRDLSANVGEDRPHRYKITYWLEHGQVADKRYILGFNCLEDEIIEPFLKDKSAHIRRSIAERKILSENLASKLTQDKAKTVREALARNVACPANCLSILTQDKELTVREAALANSSCPEEAVHAAKLAEAITPKAPVKPVSKLNEAEIIQRLGDPSTDAATLSELVQLDLAYVKAGVALHENTDRDTLAGLANESGAMIKQSLAFNPNTPASVLQSFLSESVYHSALASNPALSEADQLSLVTCMTDKDRLILADTTEYESVWCAIRDSEPSGKADAKTTRMRESLKKLLDSTGKGIYQLQQGQHTRQLFVAKLVARHPKCSPGLRKHYAYYLMDSLAKNPDVALQLLENPNAIRAEAYADWKIEQWLLDGRAPGHVSNYYLQSDDVRQRRRAVDNWTAQLSKLQPQVFHDDLLLRKRLAAKSGNTHFMFEILARDKKEVVRELVAKNKECPAQTLAVLATDKVAAVKVAARQNKNFKVSLLPKNENDEPEVLRNKGPKKNRMRMAEEAKRKGVLQDLAGDKVEDVRLCVARNKLTADEVLETLAKDSSAKVRAAVARHENVTQTLLESMFDDSDDEVRYLALSHHNHRTSVSLNTVSRKHDDYDYGYRRFNEEVLEKFYDDQSEKIQQLVARCTANHDIQLKFTRFDESVRCALAENKQLSLDVSNILIESKDTKVLRRLVENTRDENIFIKAVRTDPKVASSLERNYFLIKRRSIQEALVSHSSEEVRKASIFYIKDRKLLLQLAKDASDSVKETLCYSNALTKEHIDELLRTQPSTTLLASLNRQCSSHVLPHLERFIENGNEDYRCYIASYLELPASAQATLVKDPSEKVRAALAKNGVLSKQTVECLYQDSSKEVLKTLSYYHPKV